MKTFRLYSTLFCLYFLLMIGISSSIKAQVSDDFSDFDLKSNPTWFGDDSLFQVNLNSELQSNARTGTSGEISLVIPILPIGKSLVWKSGFRYGFNPSSQNVFRFFLYADSLTLLKSTNSLYLQFGGSTGSTDSLLLVHTNNGQRRTLARGRPSTLGKSLNSGAFKVLFDSSGFLSVWLDTASSTFFNKEFELPFQFDSTLFYTGYSFKYTSTNTKNFYADDFYFGPILFDTIPPKITKANMLSSQLLEIELDESIDTSAENLEIILNNQLIGFKTNWAQSNKTLRIILDKALPDSLLELKLSGIQDLTGNLMGDSSLFLFYHQIQKQELLFSEIMFDPEPSKGLANAEYLEMYNAGKFPISLKGIKITDGSGTSILPDFTLKPDAFLLLYAASDSSLFQGKFSVPLANFPSLNNSGDRLQMIGTDGLIIDDVSYDMSWFGTSALPDGGISLSLIYPTNLCEGKKAWAASKESIGGSPGERNLGWNILPDTIAPVLCTYQTINQTKILLVFDDKTSLGKLKYLFNSDSIEADFVWSSFSNDSFIFNWLPLAERETRMFQLNNWSDCSGNQLNQQAGVFYMTASEAYQNDVLIHEVLFDTEFNNEFVELFNKSDRLIQLKNMLLKRGSSFIKLPEYLLYPDSFVVLCKEPNINFKNPLAFSSFPSLSLSDSLFLFNSLGFRVHEVYYNQNWYHDEFKKQQKSWSIEMIDSENPCTGMTNWTASANNEFRHTAGLVNSVKESNSDMLKPEFTRIYPVSNSEILFYFNEPIDSNSLFVFKSDLFDGSRFISFNNNQTFLYKNESPFDTVNLISIKLNGMKDCAGNILFDTLISFKFPVEDSTAIILNEVLFNPKSGGSDFIELYNRSSNFIDLKNYHFASSTDLISDYKEVLPIYEKGYFMPPNSYLVFTEINQTDFYPNVNSKLQLFSKIPSLPDDGIYLHLLDKSGYKLETMLASDELHFNTIVDKEGVSLERLSLFSNPQNNWTSSSAFCAYASPTQKNCMLYKENTSNETLVIEPEIISPDGDGFQDFLQINYRFTSNDITMNLFIINERGLKVKELALAERVGYEGFFLWDGTTDNGSLPNEGVYLVRQEFFNSNGQFEVNQKPILFTRRARID